MASTVVLNCYKIILIFSIKIGYFHSAFSNNSTEKQLNMHSPPLFTPTGIRGTEHSGLKKNGGKFSSSLKIDEKGNSDLFLQYISNIIDLENTVFWNAF